MSSCGARPESPHRCRLHHHGSGIRRPFSAGIVLKNAAAHSLRAGILLAHLGGRPLPQTCPLYPRRVRSPATLDPDCVPPRVGSRCRPHGLRELFAEKRRTGQRSLCWVIQQMQRFYRRLRFDSGTAQSSTPSMSLCSVPTLGAEAETTRKRLPGAPPRPIARRLSRPDQAASGLLKASAPGPGGSPTRRNTRYEAGSALLGQRASRTRR